MAELYRLVFSSGKSYIGATSRRASNRFWEHGDAVKKGSKKLIHQTWRKFGPPKLKVLAILEDADAVPAEIRAIKVFGTLAPGGYNSTAGGGFSDFNPMQVPEIAAKTSATLTGRKLSPEHCKHISEVHLGKKATKATRKKMSLSATGRVCSEDTCKKVSRVVTKDWEQSSAEKRRARIAPMLAARGIVWNG